MRIAFADLRPAFYSIGIFLLILSGMMLIPLTVDLSAGATQSRGFFLSVAITFFAGGLLTLAYRTEEPPVFQIRTAFFFTAFAWIVVCLFSALPFAFFDNFKLTWSLSVLESTSALTTTGLSSFKTIGRMPPSLLIWRMLLQWLGGLGITIMALTLFPFLKVGGMQLFSTESSSHYDKILPKVSQIAKFLFSFYTFLTLSCLCLLWLAGMTPLKAFCYSVSAVSTSGMSMVDQTINYLDSPFIPWILMFYMLISASPLLLFVGISSGNLRPYFHDTQVRAYLKTAVIICAVVTSLMWWRYDDLSFFDLKRTLFQTLSMLTTAGFYADGVNPWPSSVEFLFVMLALIGGCTGSTAGGVKIFRFQVLFRAVRAQTYRMIMPHGVFTPVYNKRIIHSSVIYAVLTLLILFFLHICVLIFILLQSNLAMGDSLELSVNILSNCGAHFFPLDIPRLPHHLHWALSFGMLLGRLEFLTIWILFIPFFWRR